MKESGQNAFIQTVRKTVEEHKMLEQVRKAVIAFSAGPDSVCALDVLHMLYRKKIEFALVYVDHGLRARKDIMKEVKLTQVYALKYGIPCKIMQVKVRKSREGIEAAAREARYDALQKYMRESHAQRIIFGHNSDDVVETFLMNFIRGSGAAGLSSFPPVRLPFIRPLINTAKKDILKYVKNRKFSFSEDETNRSLSFRRNLLRHAVIPELIKINPDLHMTVKREIELIRQDDEALEVLAAEAHQKSVKVHADYVTLDIKKLLRYNRAILSRVVRRVIKEYLGSLQGFESKHFQEILRLKDKESGKRIHLPKRISARREYDTIIVEREQSGTSRYFPVNEIDGCVKIGDCNIKTRRVSQFDLKQRPSQCEVFDLKQLRLPLFIRSRQHGDVIEMKTGRKKLKKVFNEYRIPFRKRKDLLLLCDGKGILMIIGFSRAYRALINQETREILVVEYEHAH